MFKKRCELFCRSEARMNPLRLPSCWKKWREWSVTLIKHTYEIGQTLLSCFSFAQRLRSVKRNVFSSDYWSSAIYKNLQTHLRWPSVEEIMGIEGHNSATRRQWKATKKHGNFNFTKANWASKSFIYRHRKLQKADGRIMKVGLFSPHEAFQK